MRVIKINVVVDDKSITTTYKTAVHIRNIVRQVETVNQVTVVSIEELDK